MFTRGILSLDSDKPPKASLLPTISYRWRISFIDKYLTRMSRISRPTFTRVVYDTHAFICSAAKCLEAHDKEKIILVNNETDRDLGRVGVINPPLPLRVQLISVVTFAFLCL